MLREKNHEFFTVFHTAINNLENFNRLNESTAVPNILHLDVQNQVINGKSSSALKRTFHFFQSYIKSLFSSHLRNQQKQKNTQIREELLRSVMTIKKHHLILDKFRQGSEEQQKLAFFAQNVIVRYNEVIKQAKKNHPSLSNHLIQFFYKRLGIEINEELKNNTIDLPTPVVIQSESPRYQDKKFSQVLSESHSIASCQKISALANLLPNDVKPSHYTLTQHEMDAFYMKAITMIRNHAIPMTSIREALNFVKTHPIVVTLDTTSPIEGFSVSKTVLLSQKLTLFPGEEIEVDGLFKRDSQSAVISAPISDSFQLSSKSIQNGFPHPSQHHGWALTDLLIPACPLRIDRLPLLQALLGKKKQIAINLLPQGELIGKAKQLLKLKRYVFDHNCQKFLEMHQTLNHLMAEHVYRNACTVKTLEPINSYFKQLQEQSSPFDSLSQTIQLINVHFIEVPLKRLEEAWLEGTNPELRGNPQTRLTGAQTILNQEIERAEQDFISQSNSAENIYEKVMLYYIGYMGKIISSATNPIILQQLSEKIEFPESRLDQFSRQMLLSLYSQVFSFHRELLMDLTENAELQIEQHLKKILEADCSLFNLDNPYCDNNEEAKMLVDELERYYMQNSHYTRD